MNVLAALVTAYRLEGESHRVFIVSMRRIRASRHRCLTPGGPTGWLVVALRPWTCDRSAVSLNGIPHALPAKPIV